jgi:hypothetical protein
MTGREKNRLFHIHLFFLVLFLAGCSDQTQIDLQVPRGYMSTLTIEVKGTLVRFGPFVGYYFRPLDPQDLSRLSFVCFNERDFYTSDVPTNAQLYQGEAVLVTLPETEAGLPSGDGRIQPLFFPDAPPQWLDSRPSPQDQFVHFHSCHNARGPVRQGYWLRHVAVADFTYDMGGRVGPDSALYHRVRKGVDREFARIIEFDRGPR